MCSLLSLSRHLIVANGSKFKYQAGRGNSCFPLGLVNGYVIHTQGLPDGKIIVPPIDEVRIYLYSFSHLEKPSQRS
jgi:hypothetical protein